VVDSDPTIRKWPLSEYQLLIKRSNTGDIARKQKTFYLKISKQNGVDIGYIQLEVNTPNAGVLWIPMLCIAPEFQRHGFGAEVVESVILD